MYTEYLILYQFYSKDLLEQFYVPSCVQDLDRQFLLELVQKRMEESTSDSVHVMQSLMKAVIDLNDELADTANSAKISPELFCVQPGLVSDVLAGEVKYILESQNIDCADLRRSDQYFVLGLLQQSAGKYEQAFETLE